MKDVWSLSSFRGFFCCVFVACLVFLCLGVESFAGAERRAAARQQDRPGGLSAAGARNWTAGKDSETAPGPFSASNRQHACLNHSQHVSVAMDVQVRHRCLPYTTGSTCVCELLNSLTLTAFCFPPSPESPAWPLACPGGSLMLSAWPPAVWACRAEERMQPWWLNLSTTRSWSSTGEPLQSLEKQLMMQFSVSCDGATISARLKMTARSLRSVLGQPNNECEM